MRTEHGHDVADLAKFTLRYTVPAAFALLPKRMDTPEAVAMLLAIALQESRFRARRQKGGGPARGFWQFESGGGVFGVLNHPKTSLWSALACQALCYPSTVEVCYPALEHHDVLACVFARLLLWTVPTPLPPRHEPELAWQQYLSAWRPGKPHRATWDGYYAEAWQLVCP
jgi:hypothetical protein